MKTSSKGLCPLDEGNSLRSAQSVFFDVHTAAKNGFQFIRGFRAANSVRPFQQAKRTPLRFYRRGVLFFYSYFFLARERMTSSVTMHRSIVMSMSGRVLPTMMSTFISRRYSTKPITQMMRLRAS